MKHCRIYGYRSSRGERDQAFLIADSNLFSYIFSIKFWEYRQRGKVHISVHEIQPNSRKSDLFGPDKNSPTYAKSELCKVSSGPPRACMGQMEKARPLIVIVSGGGRKTSFMVHFHTAWKAFDHHF